jgi:hypothetical protein
MYNSFRQSQDCQGFNICIESMTLGKNVARECYTDEYCCASESLLILGREHRFSVRRCGR